MKTFTTLYNIKNISMIIGVIITISFISINLNTNPRAVADTETIKKWIADGALIVDVRTPEEYQAGNYKGSINIPLAELEKELNRFGDKNRKIVVYCRSGNRSGIAKEMLQNHGYKHVLNGGSLVNMPD